MILVFWFEVRVGIITFFVTVVAGYWVDLLLFIFLSYGRDGVHSSHWGIVDIVTSTDRVAAVSLTTCISTLALELVFF